MATLEESHKEVLGRRCLARRLMRSVLMAGLELDPGDVALVAEIKVRLDPSTDAI